MGTAVGNSFSLWKALIRFALVICHMHKVRISMLQSKTGTLSRGPPVSEECWVMITVPSCEQLLQMSRCICSNPAEDSINQHIPRVFPGIQGSQGSHRSGEPRGAGASVLHWLVGFYLDLLWLSALERKGPGLSAVYFNYLLLNNFAEKLICIQRGKHQQAFDNVFPFFPIGDTIFLMMFHHLIDCHWSVSTFVMVHLRSEY